MTEPLRLFYRAQWFRHGQWFVAGVWAQDEVVDEAPPILHWAIGKSVRDVRVWVNKQRSGTFVFIANNREPLSGRSRN